MAHRIWVFPVPEVPIAMRLPPRSIQSPPASASMCAFAGVWRGFKGNYGGEQRELVTSSIITTTPNELVKETHPDRMPVILDPEDYTAWLSAEPDDAFGLIRPYPAEKMVIHQSGEGLKSDRGGL